MAERVYILFFFPLSLLLFPFAFHSDVPFVFGFLPLLETRGPSRAAWTEPTLREGNVLTIGFVKFGLRFLYSLARQTIRLRLCLCKSLSLLVWWMFYFKVKQQQTSLRRSEGFWMACHSSLACLAFLRECRKQSENWKCFQTQLSNGHFVINRLFLGEGGFWFGSKWFEAFA